jgi:hypothetical protein
MIDKINIKLKEQILDKNFLDNSLEFLIGISWIAFDYAIWTKLQLRWKPFHTLEVLIDSLW